MARRERAAGTRWARRLRAATATAAAVVLVWPVVDLGVSTVWSHRRVDAAHLDAVVVLGSSLDHGRVTPLLERRVERAAALVADARAAAADPWVVASGGVTGDVPLDGEPVSEAAAVGECLLALGVGPDRLLLEERALTTASNLVLSLALLRSTDPDVHRVAVVTSDGHVARVRLLLRQAVGDGSVDTGWDVVLVGAGTPAPDVRAALLRELSLVAGQRAGVAVTTAVQQSRRFTSTAEPV